MPRFSSEKKPSTVLVWTCPRAYSFLLWFRSQVRTDADFQKMLLDKATELKKIALSDASVYVYKNYGINVLDSFPVHAVENQKFLEYQWPQIKKWFEEKVNI